MDRRTTLQWILAASAGMPLVRLPAFGEEAPALQPAARGYGSDPNLSRTYHPGDVWPLTLTSAQRRAAAALCDVIIPGDAHSPSASAVGVVDFLDEWLSAPYPRQRQDRSMLLEGLMWIDAEATRRYAQRFIDLNDGEQQAICDDVCCAANVQPSFARAARFFARFRDLTAGGFYSAPQGRQDLGYLGNVRQTRFDGPPRDVLRKLALDTAAP
jgi:Gluconate 2-dehydrogenase subunit 3